MEHRIVAHTNAASDNIPSYPDALLLLLPPVHNASLPAFTMVAGLDTITACSSNSGMAAVGVHSTLL